MASLAPYEQSYQKGLDPLFCLANVHMKSEGHTVLKSALHMKSMSPHGTGLSSRCVTLFLLVFKEMAVASTHAPVVERHTFPLFV